MRWKTGDTRTVNYIFAQFRFTALV